MAITNGTFDANLSGWTTSGSITQTNGTWDVIWDSGRARLRTYRCARAFMSQTFVIDRATLSFDYDTFRDGADGLINHGWKLEIGGITIFNEGIPGSFYVNTHMTGTIIKDVCPYIGQTAILTFYITEDTYGCNIYGYANYYIWIDNVSLSGTTSTSRLIVTTTPPGANVFVDNINQNKVTPYSECTDIGTHTYKLTLAGYQDLTGNFGISSGQNTTIDVTFLGSAYFTSTPSGARIWIDSVDKGVYTPGTITGLTTGSHSYTLVLTGHTNATGTFTATSGQTVNVPVVFPDVASYTTVASNNIKWRDDTYRCMCCDSSISSFIYPTYNITGVVRISYQVYPAPSLIDSSSSCVVKKNGVDILETARSYDIGSPDVVDTVTADVSISLTPLDVLELYFYSSAYDTCTSYIQNFRISFDATDGDVYFTTTPSGARIWIDNIDKGVNTPNLIMGISPGSHTYRLTSTGCPDATGSFTAIAGSTINVPITFPGNLSISSTPSVARIWLAHPTGTAYVDQGVYTNTTITGLETGTYDIKLILAGYQDWISTNNTINPCQTTNVPATLTSTCGTPACNLIVLSILSEQLLEKPPGYLDLDELSRYVDYIINNYIVK